MEPVRVVLGASTPVAEALRRLDAHEAAMAPVVAGGRRVAGILPRSTAQDATRMGAGGIAAGDLICGGAPSVTSAAGPYLMKKRILGVAPALLVSGPRGVVMGTISRRRIAELPGPARSRKRNLGARIWSLVGEPRTLLLRRAGALAMEQGVALHLAGGVVRDLLMGTVPRDLDLVVEGDGIGFATRFAKLSGGTFTSHERFGTAVIQIAAPAGSSAAALRIDVATARRETYLHPAALPEVKAGSILDDQCRRDVTINSMTIRLDGRRFGTLVDETGGQSDLRRRALRVHHKMSLVEDPTRAFRIARFAVRFGFEPAGETRDSLALAIRLGAFDRLGGERLHRELTLIAGEPNPGRVWGFCAANGLLHLIGPALRWDADARSRMGRFFRGLRGPGLASIAPQIDPAMIMLMISAAGASRELRKLLAARLKLAGGAAGRLEDFAERLRALTAGLSRQPGAGKVVRLCETAHPEILALAWTVGGRAARCVAWYLRELRLVRPTVSGADLRAMGLKAGPGFAIILAALRAAILDGRVGDADEERRMALRLVRARQHER